MVSRQYSCSCALCSHLPGYSRPRQPKASCRGVWIVSPSSQLKGPHSRSVSPTQGATQRVWIVGCLHSLTTIVSRQSPIAKGLHRTTQQHRTTPYRTSLFLRYDCRCTHGFRPTPTATNCFLGAIFNEQHDICIAPGLARSGAQSMDTLMEQTSQVFHIAVYSISYGAGKPSAKRVLGPTISQPSNKFRPTPTATSCRG